MQTASDSLKLAQYIDHTLLRPDATEPEIVRTCEEARTHHFHTVCISPKYVKLAAQQLAGTKVLPITVIGFPSGEPATLEKVKETSQAVADGAKEVDMVLNRTWLKEKNYQLVLEDITAVVKAAGGIPVKVILETSELTQAEKVAACVLCDLAGASFVKTSTGFSKSGATVEDVRLMREVVGTKLGVKASGGVRTHADALKMIEAGASRLGTSASIAIVTAQSGSSTGGY